MPRKSAIGRAVELIEVVAELGHDMSVRDIASEARLPLQTVHRTLRVLSDEHLVSFDRLGGSYSLGARSLQFAAAILKASPMDRLARPIMRSLMRETRAAVTLNQALPQDGTAIVLAVEETKKPWRYVPEPGETESLYGSAAGKAILAFLPTGDVDAIIERLYRTSAAGRPTHDAARLTRELAAIRRRGIAVTKGDGVNATCIAAPVLDGLKRAVGSLAITIPESTLGAQRKARWVHSIKSHAAQLSGLLGCLEVPTGRMRAKDKPDDAVRVVPPRPRAAAVDSAV